MPLFIGFLVLDANNVNLHIYSLVLSKTHKNRRNVVDLKRTYIFNISKKDDR